MCCRSAAAATSTAGDLLCARRRSCSALRSAVRTTRRGRNRATASPREGGLRGRQAAPLAPASARHAPVADPRGRGCGARSAASVYLVWRPLETMHGAPLWLSLPLYGSEGIGSADARRVLVCRLDRYGRRAGRRSLGKVVDVLVPTYNESDEVLRPMLLGCLGLDYPAVRIHLLDDGRRSWVAALAAEFGIEYHTRSDNAHAKAGNINAALPALSGELVLVLDADHVPQPDMLAAHGRLLRGAREWRWCRRRTSSTTSTRCSTPPRMSTTSRSSIGSSSRAATPTARPSVRFGGRHPPAGAGRGGRTRDRDDHRGLPYLAEAPQSRLAEPVSQRAARLRDRAAQHRAVPASARPLGVGQPRGAAYGRKPARAPTGLGLSRAPTALLPDRARRGALCPPADRHARGARRDDRDRPAAAEGAARRVHPDLRQPGPCCRFWRPGCCRADGSIS